MGYNGIFFDADETLLDFRKSEAHALLTVCTHYSIPWDENLLKRYHWINQELWHCFERGEVTQGELRIRRFQILFEEMELPVDSIAINTAYTQALSQCSFLLDGALELVKALHPHMPLYIVTNGGAFSQHGRINGSPLAPYIKNVFISEELGAKKPDPLFFQKVFEEIGGTGWNPSPQERARYLLLGDSLTADMRGGRESGLTTCWFCPESRVPVPSRDCDYVISSLDAFIPIALERV